MISTVEPSQTFRSPFHPETQHRNEQLSCHEYVFWKRNDHLCSTTSTHNLLHLSDNIWKWSGRDSEITHKCRKWRSLTSQFHAIKDPTLIFEDGFNMMYLFCPKTFSVQEHNHVTVLSWRTSFHLWPSGGTGISESLKMA